MKYKLADHVTLTEVDNEVVLLDLNAGHYFGINHIGAYYLNAIHNQSNTSDTIYEIARDYQQDISQVSQDIDELIASLLEQGLLVNQIEQNNS